MAAHLLISAVIQTKKMPSIAAAITITVECRMQNFNQSVLVKKAKLIDIMFNYNKFAQIGYKTIIMIRIMKIQVK